MGLAFAPGAQSEMGSLSWGRPFPDFRSTTVLWTERFVFFVALGPVVARHFNKGAFKFFAGDLIDG
jgi:hypothetical protein